MDDLGYLNKEENKNKKTPRYILFAFMSFLICSAVILGVAFYYKYDNRNVGFSENNFKDLEILEVNPRINIDNDQKEMFRDSSYVSTDDLEKYVFLNKVGSSIYLIPNDSSEVDIYKSEDGKLIIEIKD